MNHPQEQLARIIIFLDEFFYKQVTVLVKDKFCSVQGVLNRRDRLLPTTYLVNDHGSALFQATDVQDIVDTTIYLRD